MRYTDVREETEHTVGKGGVAYLPPQVSPVYQQVQENAIFFYFWRAYFF